MSADIVNLRKARKVRDRAAKEKRAEENRAKFGRTKSERKRTEADEDLRARRLEQHRRDADEDGGEGGSEPPS